MSGDLRATADILWRAHSLVEFICSIELTNS
jgi:hypothetical protein